MTTTMNRRAFLAAAGALAVTTAKPSRAAKEEDVAIIEARKFLERHLAVDLHVHTPMKTEFLRRDFYARHRAFRGTWPYGMRADGPSLRKGGVGGILSTIYIAEPEIWSDCKILRYLVAPTPGLRRLRNSAQRPADEATLLQIYGLEESLENHGDEAYAAIARSAHEFETLLGDDTLAVVHAVEGGHSLNGKLENVKRFHDLGVAMMTLAHFYPAGIAGNVRSIPDKPGLNLFNCFEEQRGYEHSTDGLFDFGRLVVERMMDLGMLIDLAHCTRQARADVLDITQNRTPVVMSHVGAFSVAARQKNPTDSEIRRIADGGGVIGVIFLGYFLAEEPNKRGIEDVVRTIDALINAGGAECVALGSDFDAFTNPPNDLREPADLPHLVARLRQQYDDGTVAKIVGGNARRVLREGWRGPGSA